MLVFISYLLAILFIAAYFLQISWLFNACGIVMLVIHVFAVITYSGNRITTWLPLAIGAGISQFNGGTWYAGVYWGVFAFLCYTILQMLIMGGFVLFGLFDRKP